MENIYYTDTELITNNKIILIIKIIMIMKTNWFK